MLCSHCKVRPKVASLLTMTCDNEWQAMEYEGKWGGKYLPSMNKDGYRY